MNTFSKQRTTSLLTGLYSQLVFQSLKFLKNHKKNKLKNMIFKHITTQLIFYFFSSFLKSFGIGIFHSVISHKCAKNI